MEDTGERESEKSQKQTSVTIKTMNKIFHIVEPINTSNSQENIEKNDTEWEENVILQNQETSPENNFTQSSTEKDTNHNRRANNYNRSGNKKSVIILGNRMTKLLNSWEMAKRIQSNCKIYVKTFSRATVSCMEGNLKPSLRNSPDHFHFACWDERSVFWKIFYGNHRVHNKSAMPN